MTLAKVFVYNPVVLKKKKNTKSLFTIQILIFKDGLIHEQSSHIQEKFRPIRYLDNSKARPAMSGS